MAIRKAEGGRRGAEAKTQEIKSKIFKLNFMPMKISCNDELPEYYSSEFSCLRLPPAALLHFSIAGRAVVRKSR
jgi:hypothetical protein